jgi:hypothetical protein
MSLNLEIGVAGIESETVAWRVVGRGDSECTYTTVTRAIVEYSRVSIFHPAGDAAL